MKVLPFKIPKATNSALIVQVDKAPTFYEHLHQHAEIQLSFIFSGRGHLVVGDAIKDYQANDVLLFGSHVPHVLKSDPSHDGESHLVSLFFTMDSFGDGFFNLNEFRKIKALLDKSELGLKINCPDLRPRFEQIIKSNKTERILLFFSLLHDLTLCCKQETVATFTGKKLYTDNEGKRMSAVFELALNEYHRDIALEEAASRANMTTNAFCRYFKQRTNKTFVQFLTEIRIENSCKLLLTQGEWSVGEIAYMCGFKNISNYNRKFKQVKGCTPTAFKRRLQN